MDGSVGFFNMLSNMAKARCPVDVRGVEFLKAAGRGTSISDGSECWKRGRGTSPGRDRNDDGNRDGISIPDEPSRGREDSLGSTL